MTPAERSTPLARLTRRQLLPMAGAALATASLGRQGVAATDDWTLLDNLYNLAWIPDGSPWRNHIYVISAPWCPVCKRFFNQTRSLVSRVQLRWIPAGSVDGKWRVFNAQLALSRDVGGSRIRTLRPT
jgi:hypothetical protein